MLVTVKHRKDVYDNPDRFAYQINPVTGGIEFFDMVSSRSGSSPGRRFRRTDRRCSPPTPRCS